MVRSTSTYIGDRGATIAVMPGTAHPNPITSVLMVTAFPEPNGANIACTDDNANQDQTLVATAFGEQAQEL